MQNLHCKKYFEHNPEIHSTEFISKPMENSNVYLINNCTNPQDCEIQDYIKEKFGQEKIIVSLEEFTQIINQYVKKIDGKIKFTLSGAKLLLLMNFHNQQMVIDRGQVGRVLQFLKQNIKQRKSGYDYTAQKCVNKLLQTIKENSDTEPQPQHHSPPSQNSLKLIEYLLNNFLLDRYNYSPYSKMQHEEIFPMLRGYGFDEETDIEKQKQKIINMLLQEKLKYQIADL